jgi:hypothetical protein
MADYRGAGAGGRGGTLYTIAGVESRECPVSRIDESTRAAVEQFARARRMKEATGAAPWGPDLSAWPAREVDLFDLLELEHARTENARYEAERESRD